MDFGILATHAPWTIEDWAERMNTAFSLAVPQRRAALRDLGMKLSDEAFVKAEKQAENKGSAKQQVRVYLEQWTLTNPKAAVRWAWAQTVCVPTKTDDLLEQVACVIVTWARADWKAARAYVQELPEGELRTVMTKELDRRRPRD